MKIRNLLTFTIIALSMIIIMPASAQKKSKIPKKARITFDITYAEEMEPAQLAMLPTQAFSYFMGNYTKEEITLGPTTIYVIKNFETKSLIQLSEGMGQKFYIEVSEEERKEADGSFSNINVTFPDETMEIAGYVCKKAIVTYEDEEYDEAQTKEVYFSDELGDENTNFSSSLYSKVPGRLMKYEISLAELVMTLTASSVEKARLKETDFGIPTDYEEFDKEKYKQGQ